MGQGETGVGGDGAVKRLDRAGVEGQRQIAALNVGVPRGGGGGGQGQVVSVRQHGGFSSPLSSKIYRPLRPSHKGARRSRGSSAMK